MDVLTLPCARDRHGSCAGRVGIGIARHRQVHECFCDCHFAVPAAFVRTPDVPA